MTGWHGINPGFRVNRGGAVDVRRSAIRCAALAHGSNRDFESAVFKEKELSVRGAKKSKDDHGRLIIANDGSKLYCSVCSEFVSIFCPTQRLRRHKHEDSALWRSSIFNSSTRYPCHTCANPSHSFNIVELNRPWTCGRIPVIATSSTLYQFQGRRDISGYRGDPIHVERVSVCGATIKEIGHAICYNYFDLGAPVDILLIAGLNDVAAGRSAIEIMCDLTMLLEAIQVNLPGSTLSVSTLPLPPKLCRLRGDRSWRPASFVDRTSTLVSLNARIINFNRVNARSVGAPLDMAPRYHTRGLRTRLPWHRLPADPHNMLRNVLGHRYAHWRENHPHSMLHLSSRVKLSMGRAAIKFFLAFYGVIRRRTSRRSRELVDAIELLSI